MSSAEFVADVGQKRQLLGVHQLGDLLDQPRFRHLIGNLGDDDDPGAARAVLDVPRGAHAEAAAAGLVGFADRGLVVDDDAAGGEVRPLDDLEQVAVVGLRVARSGAPPHRAIRPCCAAGSRSPCRPRCRPSRWPANAARRPAAPPARSPSRSRWGGNRRCRRPARRAGARGLGEAGLGVAHGGGAIAIDIAEIALAVDQRVALGEILGEAHQGVVDRLVAVRVELADDVADDAGALLERRTRIEPQQPAWRTARGGGRASGRRAHRAARGA